ncbi:MAG TPA: hypothetical protein VFZ66_03570 [Herpetosiphonaceae bacterium]
MDHAVRCIDGGQRIEGVHRCPTRSRRRGRTDRSSLERPLDATIREQTQREGPINPITVALRAPGLRVVANHQWV